LPVLATRTISRKVSIYSTIYSFAPDNQAALDSLVFQTPNLDMGVSRIVQKGDSLFCFGEENQFDGSKKCVLYQTDFKLSPPLRTELNIVCDRIADATVFNDIMYLATIKGKELSVFRFDGPNRIAEILPDKENECLAAVFCENNIVSLLKTKHDVLYRISNLSVEEISTGLRKTYIPAEERHTIIAESSGEDAFFGFDSPTTDDLKLLVVHTDVYNSYKANFSATSFAIGDLNGKVWMCSSGSEFKHNALVLKNLTDDLYPRGVKLDFYISGFNRATHILQIDQNHILVTGYFRSGMYKGKSLFSAFASIIKITS
jgi:hypothetical protein